ncbi:MAG: DUF922 domain-containing Zn-dependent protease [Proteobacteria bacterium]|nr:DUF922 domain-containing Zn-dependent protease [Pseudomonadota bacterium]
MRLLPVIAAAAFVLAAPAHAHKELTVTYPVKGSTPGEIQQDINKNGPMVGRRVPYAFTTIASKTTKKTEERKGSCRYKSYKTSMIFTYVLPKLHGGKGLAKATLADWNNFTRMLKEHEKLHKDNWSKCLADFDDSVPGIEASTCEKLEKKVEKQLNTKKISCLRNDMKLDDAFGRQLWKDPFVKEALKQSRGGSKAVFGLLGRKDKKPAKSED